MESTADRAVAIVGLGAILPDAPNAPAFWKNILGKRYSISDVPSERWSAAHYYDPDPAAPDKTYSKIGGWVRGFTFDWQRFRIPPKVAAAMDESQQWAVTIAAEALADYGYPDRPLNTENTGVIIGTAMGGELHYKTNLRVSFPEYAQALAATPDFQRLPAEVRAALLDRWHEQIERSFPPITEDSMPGELANIVAGRVANVLNLRGPNFITDAACASTFAAIAAAVEMLDEGHVDAVIAGGVDRNMGASTFVKFCKIGALSATGTRPFGDGADGFVMGEGAALFLLRRLADAERAGDKIYAVIRGVGASSDGKGKGITAPNPVGQVLAISRGWQNAGLEPATATLVEAHGTSTKVGDVVEVESLTKIFGGAERGRIALGSAKSNIGHLKAGAGAAGLLKTVMALHDKMLPPTLNSEKPNPNIDFNATPFVLNHELREWERPADGPRRAGVSAYGFGGTNFHAVLEEYVPGLLTQEKVYTGASVEGGGQETRDQRPERPALSSGSPVSYLSSPVSYLSSPITSAKQPIRGILALSAETPVALKDALDETFRKVEAGWVPPIALPAPEVLRAKERLMIDFGEHNELLDKLGKARKAAGFDNPQAWKALQAQGIFRGGGAAPGKVAFLFPGQGSQYSNMGRELARISPTVKAVFDEADRVMTPILGKPLTSYIFVDVDDPAAMKQAEKDLMQTAITQPAMLTLDAAIYKLLADYGFTPDMVMGHSLGEYAALTAAGIMPFADALEAAAARGSEMTKVSVGDNGWMAAVMAPLDVVQRTLQEIDGYVVAANINSYGQAVIGGASKAVEQAIEIFTQKGFQAQRIPVSHAFHTKIVAPASGPLRQVLNRLHIAPPQLPLVANVTGELYPTEVEAIKDLLEQQIASPVQWVKGIETLYANGVRTFVEVGPKKALKGFVDDVLGNKPEVVSLFSNHPKTGELASFNHVLCGLYAAGYGISSEFRVPSGRLSSELPETNDEGRRTNQAQPAAMTGTATVTASVPVPQAVPALRAEETTMTSGHDQSMPQSTDALSQLLIQALQGIATTQNSATLFDRNAAPAGSVVISGTGLGLPGAEKPVMDADNAQRILRGEQFIDLIPERFRKQMLAKHVTRLVKSADGDGHFETITDPDEVIKLAGRPGTFDLAEEYGVPAKLVEALDITTQLAIAAGLDALREAGIPLVQTYRKTSKGTFLPDRWMLPEPLRDETGVIFASAFPGYDRLADEFERYYASENRRAQLAALEDLHRYTQDPATLQEIGRRIGTLREEIEHAPYEFDRRFLFRILAMGHSQFAEYIGARGPNTQVNAACASTTQAIALAEDWIRTGRCRRVLVIAADDVTGDRLMEWIGAGFLATGAAATDDRVEEAALPFDRRRHGMIMGMGACGLVVESEDAVRERGMRGVVELLSSETGNSAYHGTRLDVEHIAQVMDRLVCAAERRFGIDRRAIAAQTVFVSHETYTPARGGSAAAEVTALRRTFGDAAGEIVMANTKGFTGHPMGVGIEDVIALKILEHGIVPPVPNLKEIDPDLGALTLSRGGRYPVQYAIHLAAGFGSQIAMTLTRRIPGALDRIDSRPRYERWLADVSGYDRAETEVVKRVLRVQAQGAPTRLPLPSSWQYGTGPILRASAPGAGASNGYRPAPLAMPTPEPLPVLEQVIAKPNSLQAPAKLEATKTPDELATNGAPYTNGYTTTPVPTPVAISTVAPAATDTFVRDSRTELAQEPSVVSSPLSVAVQRTTDDVIEQVLAIVAEKTGYPRDMLDLDLDLEADLGVDTVKQAETFAAVRAAFDIPRKDDLKLRDYPTLASVIQFVRDSRPDLAQEPRTKYPEPSVVSSPLSVAVVPEQPTTDNGQGTMDEVTEQVLAIVAEKTGYPRDMLDLDLDLEADLGVDTVKQAETFAAVRAAFDIPRKDDLKLRDYPTLASVIQFVRDSRPDLAVASPQAAGGSPQITPVVEAVRVAAVAPVTADRLLPPADEVTEQVLAIVAEKTGYPTEMLELDLDLEADLGVDTVKQAETFAAVRAAFDIPRRDDLKLRDYPTLASVIQFVRDNRPDLAVANRQAAGGSLQATPMVEAVRVAAVAPVTTDRLLPTVYSVEEANKAARRVPVAALRPALDLCKPTGVTLGEGSRVIVMLDRGGVGRALVNRLEKRGVNVLPLDAQQLNEATEARVRAYLAEGTVQGVYWLPALDTEPGIEELELDSWRELNRQRVKSLYLTMRTLYEAISAPGSFLVAATRMGGLHGYGEEGATAPLGGAVTGFAKAYKRERMDVLVKAVDFEASRKTAEPADALIAETLSDPGVVEVGYHNGLRYTVTLEERPLVLSSVEGAVDEQPGMQLTRDTVFVVTGAAGGITSAIVGDLAQASAGIFYLLDLAPKPEADDPNIALFRSDKEALKRKLIDELRAAGERPTPVMVDKQILAIERAEAALRAIETVEAAGGTAYYHCVNLLDGPAVAAVIHDVRQRYGRIDVLLHAGGIEISKALDAKPPQEFDLVFDIKADGFFSLLKAAAGLPIGATIAFSSVAGRFGNSGQTDYSAANDLLCKVTSSLRGWRPATRGIVIDWTAWGGIGMATRGSIPKIMELAGIDMLPPEIGIPTIRRELTAGGFCGEIVVGQRLGILAEEFDPSGGLDVEKVERVLKARERPYLMLGQVKAAKLYGGLEVETTLDPQQQPFLYDHQIDGVPVLPGVMGTEAFAELAELLAPGYHIAAIAEQFSSPFKFYRHQPRTLHLSATISPAANGDLRALTALRSVTEPARPGLPERIDLHFSATVRLTQAPLETPIVSGLPSPVATGEGPGVRAIDKDAIYGVYFHGPAYQVLDRVLLDGEKAIGVMAANLPPNTCPESAASLMAPRLIELCFQTAGIWDMEHHGVLALPLAVGAVTTYRQPERAEGARLYAIVTAIDGGTSFGAQVVDEAGNLYVDLEGYRTVQILGSVTL